MPKRKKSSDKHAPQDRSGIPVPSALPLRVTAGVALIAVAAFIVYFPSISGGFILDDFDLLTDNPIVKASDGLYRLWCTTEPADYWPATYSTFWIEWRLWEMHSTGYHVTNLILHIGEALLIWIILRKLSIPGAFLAAAIFAVHPVNVESVAWIAQRKNLMAMLFFLLSILCYLKSEIPWPLAPSPWPLAPSPWPLAPSPWPLAPSPWPLFYWLSLIAFLLAMLSKGSAAVLPVLLLGIVYWLRPLTKRDLLRTVPFFVVAVVLTEVNVWFRVHGTGEVIRTAGFAERLLGAGGVVWFYLYKALLPLNLSFVYPQWCIEPGNPLWWLPLLATLVVTAVLWRYREGWSRPLLFAWGFFCVALMPVMGFTDVYFMKYSLVADHYQHIAIIGVIALAAAIWSLWRQRVHRVALASQRVALASCQCWAATVVAIAAVTTLAFLTWRQSGLYRDEITLYQATSEINPDCWMAHNNLGKALYDTGRLPEAIEHYQQALRLRPDYPEAHNNLGKALFDTGRLPEAIEHYQQALRLRSDYPEVHNNLGGALVQTGRTEEAIEHYQEALRLRPDNFETLNNLSVALAKAGRFQEAIEHFQQTLQMKPNYFEAHFNLGKALVQANRPQEAIEHFKQALRIRPDYFKAWNNLALAYAKMQQSAEAIAAARKALELARSQGQTAAARQIEDWLNAYRAGLSNLPKTPPSSQSDSPSP